VIPIRPQGTAPAEHAVDRSRQADRKALTASGKADLTVRLDEEMNVVCLDAELQHAVGPTRGGRKRRSHGTKHAGSTKRRDARSDTERDVGRRSRIVSLAAAVENAPATRARWATGATAGAAPGAEDEGLLGRAPHLNGAEIISNLLACQRAMNGTTTALGPGRRTWPRVSTETDRHSIGGGECAEQRPVSRKEAEWQSGGTPTWIGIAVARGIAVRVVNPRQAHFVRPWHRGITLARASGVDARRALLDRRRQLVEARTAEKEPAAYVLESRGSTSIADAATACTALAEPLGLLIAINAMSATSARGNQRSSQN
jgi:hypothetical protein